jgi:hypothetical protein
MSPNKFHEAALARLSLTAFIIDSGIVIITSAALASQLSQIGARNLFGLLSQQYSVMPYLIAFLASVLIYLFLTEIVLSGLTIGRLCAGLKIRDCVTGGSPSLPHRCSRFAKILVKLGLPALHPRKVPTHNKQTNGTLQSDWVKVNLVEMKQTTKPVTETKMSDPRVTVTSGPLTNKTVLLKSGRQFQSKGIFFIGKNANKCDLALQSSEGVSQVHCRILKKGDQLILLDGADISRKSTNGTQLNGKPVTTSKGGQLSHGDRIRLGENEIRVLLHK